MGTHHLVFISFLPMKKYDPQHMWETAHRMHDAQPLTIIEAQRPWGMVLGINLKEPFVPYCSEPLKRRIGQCSMYAGSATYHFGTGRCNWHRGNTTRGNTEGFMIMAIGYAKKLNITPAQALIDEVHRTAGAIDFLTEILTKVETREELLQEYAPWVEMYERERAFGVKVNMAAIHAGVMQIIDGYEQAQGIAMGRMLKEVFEQLELSGEQQSRAVDLITARMYAISADSAARAEIEAPPIVDMPTSLG